MEHLITSSTIEIFWSINCEESQLVVEIEVTNNDLQ